MEYRPGETGKKQKDYNDETARGVMAAEAAREWVGLLSRPSREEPDAPSLLQKHLNTYTSKNTFDYFIHKDLGTFLRRELDFYLKNEVMHLDDIDNDKATPATVDGYLAKLRAIRRVAQQVIDFVAQLEEFQKKLWLKKKLVVETSWCVTLDRIGPSLYPEIAANERQREEWVRLFAIDEIKGDMVAKGYSSPMTMEFLEGSQFLLVDTALFPPTFTQRLLAGIDDLDETTDGLLVHSENFQALTLLEASYGEKAKCIYIDPPYNTAASAIPYKNDYQHSAWVTMMVDRLDRLSRILAVDGALFVSIDKTERTVLEHALDFVFGASNHIEELIWTQGTANGQLPNYSTNHEYVEVWSKDKSAVESDADMFREPKPGYQEVTAVVSELNPSVPAIDVVEKAIAELYAVHLREFREEVEDAGGVWSSATQSQDPWRGIYGYTRAEYRDAGGQLVPEKLALEAKAKLWVWQAISAGAPAGKQSHTTKDPRHPNYRFYRPVHPVTGLACPHPKGGWKFPLKPDPKLADRRTFEDLAREGRISWGADATTVPRTKGFLHEVETNISTSVFYEYNDGESEVSRMFGASGLFLSPKSSKFVRRFVAQTTRHRDLVVDAFGGSGSSAHGVLALNREDGGQRRYLLVEMGEYFDRLLKPRVLKAAYSKDWREGYPVSRDGVSQLIKVIRLESYEDTLNNLKLHEPSDGQQTLMDRNDNLRRDYMLHYWVDVETEGSPSLLNVEHFNDPWSYTLEIARGSAAETKTTTADLVETFNYLIGLRVRHVDVVRGVTMVQGTLPSGEKALVIWRKTAEMDAEALDDFLFKQDVNPRDMEFQVIYVNGDNHLENTRTTEETWKVRLIEDEFKRLMFEGTSR